MMGGFAEELVMPEADRPVEQLAGDNGNGGVKDEVVEASGNPPPTQGVEQDAGRIGRFVRIEFVK